MRSLLLLALLATACSGGGPTETQTPFLGGGDPPGITLRNETSRPLTFFAGGEGALALFFVPPTLEPGEFDLPVVAPGETVPVTDIVGYAPELGINFFLYRVDDAGVGHYIRTHLATAAEISAANRVVTITSLDF